VTCAWPQAPCHLARRHRRIARRRSHEGAALPLVGQTLPLVAASLYKNDEPLSSSSRRQSKPDEARRTPSPPRCADSLLLPRSSLPRRAALPSTSTLDLRRAREDARLSPPALAAAGVHGRT